LDNGIRIYEYNDRHPYDDAYVTDHKLNSLAGSSSTVDELLYPQTARWNGTYGRVARRAGRNQDKEICSPFVWNL